MKHRHNGEKRHASMMEIRDVDDKNNTSGPTESTDAPTVAWFSNAYHILLSYSNDLKLACRKE